MYSKTLTISPFSVGLHFISHDSVSPHPSRAEKGDGLCVLQTHGLRGLRPLRHYRRRAACARPCRLVLRGCAPSRFGAARRPCARYSRACAVGLHFVSPFSRARAACGCACARFVAPSALYFVRSLAAPKFKTARFQRAVKPEKSCLPMLEFCKSND